MTAAAQLAEFEAAFAGVNYTRWSKADIALHNDLLHKARAERWRAEFGPGPDEPLPLDAEVEQKRKQISLEHHNTNKHNN